MKVYNNHLYHIRQSPLTAFIKYYRNG